MPMKTGYGAGPMKPKTPGRALAVLGVNSGPKAVKKIAKAVRAAKPIAKATARPGSVGPAIAKAPKNKFGYLAK